MGYFLFLMAIFLMAILLIAILLEAFFSVMQGIRQHHSAAGASACADQSGWAALRNW